MLFILGSLQISKLLRLDIHTTNNCNNFVIYKACKWLLRKNESNHLINNTLNIVNGLLTSQKNDKSNEKFLTFGKKEHRSIKMEALVRLYYSIGTRIITAIHLM